MTADRSETDILSGESPPTVVALAEGTIKANIRPLKARQFFKLLRIVTRGGGPLLGSLRLAADMSPEEFATQLLAIAVFAIPEAEDETLDFCLSMVEPLEEKDGPLLMALFADPELDDVVSVVEAVIHREKDDLVSLGKRLSRLFQTAEKTGQLPKNVNPSQADGQGPSISSSQATAGPTTPSSTSPSRGSGKSPKQQPTE